MFGLGAIFLGLLLVALGVLALNVLDVDGLVVVPDSLLVAAWTGLLTEYGPAVAGLLISGREISGLGLIFAGRVGAAESPPWTLVSGRSLAGAASDIVEVPETVRIGDNADIAEPGRAGRFLLAITAFFCAAMASLREGFGGPETLLEKLEPGRLPPSAFFGEFGLSGQFSSNLC